MDQIVRNQAPAGLVYVNDSEPGIMRRRAGRGFCYYLPGGELLRDPDERARIGALAVPPAYRNVWICIDPKGHIQATGYDDRERKQYRYHPQWDAYRSELKYGYLAGFGEALPRIRRRLREDLHHEAGDLEFTLAAMIALIDRAALRVGSPLSARENDTYGATTLLKRHLKLKDDGIRLDYRAKGGKRVRISLRHKRLNRIMEQIADLPGRHLFQWRDGEGNLRPVDSSQLNAYLAEISGGGFSVKTFRTWNGTLAAFEAALDAMKEGDRPSIKAMCAAASEVLHNTSAVCRNSYIHPDVIALSEVKRDAAGGLYEALLDGQGPGGLRASERRLLAFLAKPRFG